MLNFILFDVTFAYIYIYIYIVREEK